MSLASFLEHPAIAFAHKVILIHEQTVSYFQNIPQEFSVPGRQYKSYRRSSSEPSAIRSGPFFKPGKVLRIRFYKRSYRMIAQCVAFRPVVDVFFYPSFKYLKILWLVILPHTIDPFKSDCGFFEQV